MVAAVSFGDITIGIVEIPLAAGGASVVARSGLRVHSELGHKAGADVIEMKVAANSKLGELDFIGAENFAGAADGVVFRMMEIANVVSVYANFGSEEFRVEGKVFGAGVAVEPGEIGEGEGLGFGGSGNRRCMSGSRRRGRNSYGWLNGQRRRSRRCSRKCGPSTN